jgi:hypothetical protein
MKRLILATVALGVTVSAHAQSARDQMLLQMMQQQNANVNVYHSQTPQRPAYIVPPSYQPGRDNYWEFKELERQIDLQNSRNNLNYLQERMRADEIYMQQNSGSQRRR